MKRIICFLSSVCMLLCLAACRGEVEHPREAESAVSTENREQTVITENKQGEESDNTRVLTLEKTLHTCYEWEDDYDRALVRSEHSCVTLGPAGDASGCFQLERGRQRYKDRRDECQPIPACR